MGGVRLPGPIRRIVDRLNDLVPRVVTYTPINDLERQSTFRLSLPKLLAGFGDIPLSSGTVPGTPPDRPVDPSNQSTMKFLRPVLSLDLSNGNLTGHSVLSIPSGYPETLKGPTEIDVNLTSTKLQFSRYALPGLTLAGNASWGPITSEFKLKLQYDMGRFAKIVGPLLNGKTTPGGALDQAKTELLHPGFDFSAIVSAGIPAIGKIPITYVKASAATTVPLQRPLSGAPAPFAMTHTLYGLIPTPPGSLFDVPALGLGVTHGSYGATRGYSITAAFLPTFSPTALSNGASTLEKFPVYGYLEIYGVTRVSDGLELGARLTASPSTVDAANLLGYGQRTSNMLNDYKNSLTLDTSPIKGMIMFRLEGQFDAL